MITAEETSFFKIHKVYFDKVKEIKDSKDVNTEETKKELEAMYAGIGNITQVWNDLCQDLARAASKANVRFEPCYQKTPEETKPIPQKPEPNTTPNQDPNSVANQKPVLEKDNEPQQQQQEESDYLPASHG